VMTTFFFLIQQNARILKSQVSVSEFLMQPRSRLGILPDLGLGSYGLSYITGNYAIIWVFRAFDWPSSISTLRVMAKKINLDKNNPKYFYLNLFFLAKNPATETYKNFIPRIWLHAHWCCHLVLVIGLWLLLEG